MSKLQDYLTAEPVNKQSKACIAYLAALDCIGEKAPEIANAIAKELQDQRTHLKLIASENYSSYAVQLAMGNLLTDKYAEGFPQHRFYAGCENVDQVEQAANQQLKAIFDADASYVQPHSGADANLVAFWSILVHRVQSAELEKMGKKTIDELTPDEYEKIRKLMVNQKVLGMSLNSGGHLTHGYRHNVSAKMMQAIGYDIDPNTGLLNYDQIKEIAKKEKPAILLAGYSAYPRKINFAKMKEIADEIGAVFMVDMAHFSGLVAGKVFEGDFNPVPFADIVTSTTHKTLRGPRGGFVLCKKTYEEVINKGCPLVLGGPLPHVMAAKAIAFKEANTPEFKTYAKKIVANASSLAASLMKKGLTILTDGTENHLIIINLNPLNITGRQAENALREAGLTVNRNAIPFDKNGPWYTSGVRLGTPAVTTLGMGESEMQEIAEIMHLVLSSIKPKKTASGEISRAGYEIDPAILTQAKQRVAALLKKFPLYPELML